MRRSRLGSRGAAAAIAAAAVAVLLAAPTADAGAGATTAEFGRTAVPEARPAAPFVENVTPEGLGALVSWAPEPATDSVTSYTATATVAVGYTGTVPPGCRAPAPTTASGSASLVLATGLCATVPYTLTVSATNSVGTSAPSAPSDPVAPLPAQAPSAPLITGVLVRNGSLVVQWSPPSVAGGDPVTGYTLSAASGGGTVTVHPGATASAAHLNGLTDGTAYRLTLTAHSAAGTSVAASGAGTPSAAQTPSAPVSLQVMPNGSGDLVVTWSAPADPGSSAVKEYVVVAQPETESSKGVYRASGTAVVVKVPATTTSQTLTGLSAQGLYMVSVRARSKAGTGPAAGTPDPVTPSVEVAAGTVVLSPSTMSALAWDHSGALYWPSPAPAQVQSLSAGDVLVANTAAAAPQGLLAQVTGVSTDGSGDYTVTTTTASMSQAFTDLGFGSSSDPLTTAGAVFHPAVAGVAPVPARPGPGVKVSLGQDLSLNISEGALTVTGQVSITPTLSASGEINQDYAGIPDGVGFSASAAVTATASVTATLSGSKEIQLGEIDGAPFDVQAGPVPLIFVPKIPLFLDLSGQISVGVTAAMTVGASMSWSSRRPGTLTTKNLSVPPHFVGGEPLPGVSVTASASLDLYVQPQLDLYDLAGPNLQIDDNITASADYAGTPYFTLGGSLDLQAGLDILAFGFHKSLEVPLASLPATAYTLSTPPDADLVVSPILPVAIPGTPLTFTATRSDGTSDPVTWSVVGGIRGDRITSGGTLHVAQPEGRQLLVVAVDSTGAVGETYVTVGPDFAPPAGPAVTQKAGQPFTAEVAWGAPAPSGGTPVAGYTVVTVPATAKRTVAGTTASLTGLAPGDYVVDVYATDTAGRVSPPATAMFRVTPTGGLATVPIPGQWRASELPLPSGATTTDVPYLGSLSCSAVGSCTAVGGYWDTESVQRGLVESLTGGSWSASEAPAPAGALSWQLGNVACVTTAFCAATGTYAYDLLGSTATGSLLDTRSGTTWTSAEGPLPANGLPASGGYPHLVSVACPARGTCVAVGWYFVDGGSTRAGVIDTLSSGTWTTLEAPVPGGTAGTLTELAQVACPAAGSCTAVGVTTTAGGQQEGLVETLAGGTWTPTVAPLPAGAASTPTVASLNAVACPTTTSCEATGEYTDTDDTTAALIASFNGSDWTSVPAPVPTPVLAAAVPLGGVACGAAGSCVLGANGGVDDGSFLGTLSGGTWRAELTPVPPDGVAAPSSGLGPSVSGWACGAAGSCTTVGWFSVPTGPITDAHGPLVDTLFDGAWQAGQAPLPANAAAAGGLLQEVACPAADACTAVGDYVDTDGITDLVGESQG